MKTLVRLLLFLAVATTSTSAQFRTGDALRIYLVDVEVLASGGQQKSCSSATDTGKSV